MMVSAMLSDAFCNDEETSIKIRYRTDGRLFNLRRLHPKTKIEEDSVHDFLLADDCALNSATEAQIMNSFSNACRNVGLPISTKKTEVLHQPAPHRNQLSPLTEKA
ncbi:hypothetical protein NDU88_008676 [Pleurodeles waltl]|uniref:Reverse transcriptase domain-containing protein n=1 Tax=Pleurodeles waltl TaxID=8319 RepID=A0AAV7RWF1_PLEWA|nr:hypothetical protein NDU88_008676 [Pleurodeles waltl]